MGILGPRGFLIPLILFRPYGVIEVSTSKKPPTKTKKANKEGMQVNYHVLPRYAPRTLRLPP